MSSRCALKRDPALYIRDLALTLSKDGSTLRRWTALPLFSEDGSFCEASERGTTLEKTESVPIIYYYYTHEVRQSNEKMNQKGKTKGKGH